MLKGRDEDHVTMAWFLIYHKEEVMCMRRSAMGILLFGFLVPLCFYGCSKESTSDGSVVSPSPGKIDPAIVSADNGFGFDLLPKLLSEKEPNLFISPLSVAIALTMAYNGAGGETKDAMARVLKLEGMSLDLVNESNLELRRMLKELGPNIELLISNSLWARKGIGFKTDFLERNKKFFEAEVRELDFSDPSAPSQINGWVESSTKGKIKEIIDKIDPYTVMFLINAIYFKGIWKFKFDKSETKERPFYAVGGEEMVPMMAQSGKFPYLKGDGFQAVGLPYGNGRMSMYIFLPDRLRCDRCGNPYYDLKHFIEELSLEKWEKWMKGFEEKEGEVVIPRFKLEYKAVLNDALGALGMGIAFDPDRANFEGMRTPPPNLFIQEVRHKAVVEVNEEGTEAAAATSVGIGITAVPERFTFVADRPFFFAICDNKTGVIIFMGVLAKP
jgi:serpin B